LRLEEGHFEGDLIIGKQYNGYQNIVTLNDRKTRKLYATFVRSKDPWKVNEAFRKMIKDNNLKVKTLTLDNGIEFERISILAKHLNFKVYLCDPYASFQRGSNEHLNGMIRRM
jgi:IS30 family transposase